MTNNEVDTPEFTAADATALLAEVTAPWVQELGLQVVAVTSEISSFHLPFSPRLTRDSGSMCGQAIVGAADTAMIAATTAAIGSYVPMTTVDIACRFLRPLGSEGGDVTVKILKAGRRLVVGRVAINDVKTRKLAADINVTYARL